MPTVQTLLNIHAEHPLKYLEETKQVRQKPSIKMQCASTNCNCHFQLGFIDTPEKTKRNVHMTR